MRAILLEGGWPACSVSHEIGHQDDGATTKRLLESLIGKRREVAHGPTSCR